VLDQRTKTEMRIRMQQKTHEYRQNLHKRLQQAKTLYVKSQNAERRKQGESR